jgi:pimeloyl-ACP methyl ester carboxylesterase
MQMLKIVDENKIKHVVKEVDGLNWHYIEMGQGRPVVLVHGLPESWYAWRYQIEPLAAHFRVIVPDQKGYGQSDKRDGDYSPPTVGRQLGGLIESVVGAEKYHLVGHDWGGVITSQIAAAFPERILKYIHMSTPIHIYDPSLVPHHQAFRDTQKTAAIMRNAEVFIRAVYASSCKERANAIAEPEMLRIIEEFARPGVAEAVPRYFRDAVIEYPAVSPHWKKLTMPVYLIYPDSDPRQPLRFLDGVDKVIPGYKGQAIIRDSGHFSMQEQPDQVTKALLKFLLG